MPTLKGRSQWLPTAFTFSHDELIVALPSNFLQQKLVSFQEKKSATNIVQNNRPELVNAIVIQFLGSGMRQYCDRYGETIYNVSQDFGPVPRWEGETAERIVREMNETFPLDALPERRRWRDTRLAALARLKRRWMHNLNRKGKNSMLLAG